MPIVSPAAKAVTSAPQNKTSLAGFTRRPAMAAIKRFLSRPKIRTPSLRDTPSTYRGECSSAADEFGDSCASGEDLDMARRRQEWQDEIQEVSEEFLPLKSTNEQQDEGSQPVIDSAIVCEFDGLPALRLAFDVRTFRPDDVMIDVTDDRFVLEASGEDEKSVALYRKKMIRKVDLPPCVDSRHLHYEMTSQGHLYVIMPLYLPPQRRPSGLGVAPVVTDPNGQRKIRLSFPLGEEFTSDDVVVKITDEGHLTISAAYHVMYGKYGRQTASREINKELKLPSHMPVERVDHNLSMGGRLFLEITLKKPDQAFRCLLTAEELY